MLTQHRKNRGCVLPIRCAKHQRCDEQRLLLPQTERAPLMPPVGVIWHGALTTRLAMGTGRRGQDVGAAPRNPRAPSRVHMDSWQIPSVVSSYLHLLKFPTPFPSAGNSLSNSKHWVELLSFHISRAPGVLSPPAQPWMPSSCFSNQKYLLK